MESGHDELSELGSAISDEGFRGQISSDPEGALGKYKGKVPQEVLDAIGSLSPEQLSALASLKEVLNKHNVPPHIKAEMV